MIPTILDKRDWMLIAVSVVVLSSIFLVRAVVINKLAAPEQESSRQERLEIASKTPSESARDKALFEMCGDDSNWRVVTDGSRYKPQYRISSSEGWIETLSGVTYKSFSAAEKHLIRVRKGVLENLNTEWREVKTDK